MNTMDATNPVLEKLEIPSLRDLLAPLFRRKKLLIISFCCFLAASLLAGILLFYTKYQSEMEILVNRDRIDPAVTTTGTAQMMPPSNPLTDEEVNSETEILSSKDLLKRVVLANNLQDPSRDSVFTKTINFLLPKQTNDERVDEAVKTLAKKLKITTVDKTNLISVKYNSGDPELSFSVLDSLGNFYMEKHAVVHRPSGSFEFFEKETDRYKNALAGAEDALKTLGKEKNIAAPDEERSSLAVQVANFIGQSHTVQQSIAADQQRIKSDELQMKSTPERSSTLQSSNAADLLLQQLGSSLLASEVKRTQLLLKYELTYPLVVEADQEISATKAAIQEAESARYVNQTTDRDPTFELLREDAAKTQADLAAQQAALVAINAGVKSLQSKMVDLDQQAVTQGDLRREVKANEANYLLYLTKREQERTSDALDKTRIANVAIAIPPERSALPIFEGLPITLASIVLAFILSLAVTYGADYFDSSFHSVSDMSDALDIPVVIAMSKRTA